jgi:hypothetical protein
MTKHRDEGSKDAREAMLMFAVVPGKSKLQEQCISCESLLRHALVAPHAIISLSLSLVERKSSNG